MIAINVIGVPLEAPAAAHPGDLRRQLSSSRLAPPTTIGGGGGSGLSGSSAGWPAPASPAIDLATDVGMDAETAALLREVVNRKAAAVADENFELAKALKGAQDTIRSVGASLAVLVADKNRAVQVGG